MIQNIKTKLISQLLKVFISKMNWLNMFNSKREKTHTHEKDENEKTRGIERRRKKKTRKYNWKKLTSSRVCISCFFLVFCVHTHWVHCLDATLCVWGNNIASQNCHSHLFRTKIIRKRPRTSNQFYFLFLPKWQQCILWIFFSSFKPMNSERYLIRFSHLERLHLTLL